MAALERDLVLKRLYEAFAFVEKPIPLTGFEGSYCDEEVEVFNRLDWEAATYLDVVDAMEGFIICPADTKLWLLPRLFKMLILQRSIDANNAVDNLASDLESWPIDGDVERLLSEAQKIAIINAWAHIDREFYWPSGSHVARDLATRWGNLQ